MHDEQNMMCRKYFPASRLFSKVQGLITLTRWQDGDDKRHITSERKIIREYQDSDKIVNASVTLWRCWNTLCSKFWFRILHKHTLLFKSSFDFFQFTTASILVVKYIFLCHEIGDPYFLIVWNCHHIESATFFGWKQTAIKKLQMILLKWRQLPRL